MLLDTKITSSYVFPEVKERKGLLSTTNQPKSEINKKLLLLGTSSWALLPGLQRLEMIQPVFGERKKLRANAASLRGKIANIQSFTNNTCDNRSCSQ